MVRPCPQSPMQGRAQAPPFPPPHPHTTHRSFLPPQAHVNLSWSCRLRFLAGSSLFRGQVLSPRNLARQRGPWLGFRACRAPAAPALPGGGMTARAPRGRWAQIGVRESSLHCGLRLRAPAGGEDPSFSAVRQRCHLGLWARRTPGPWFLQWPRLFRQRWREGASYVRLCVCMVCAGCCLPAFGSLRL